ncbi:hypothetical protein HN592_00525 [Candidatus Woesearchaeota archaeon]|jgi:presenilin-like A22 family membrane protease|nr:hypothetical protein [Candidatus Woesearchaeota archaeon]MBT4368790.1 hypothetical protein [Candidatus Woesearchaeota archaeon]MBT4712079.1 hypothetical protein [Candidatus Woesearchaeota archaeon]MBT6639173.1 hypothetical protein [Candidatus Woesearchaeota archaeon]MBT7134373.1 hypothetical protein [Candidatus Woesearchaeota archaeon]
MKHTISVTVLLLIFFVLAQLIGLGIINLGINENVDANGIISFEFKETAIGERPDLQPGMSFISIIVAILVGTSLALVLIRFKLLKVWRIWFFLAIVIAMTISLGTLLPSLIAFFVALVLTILKMFKPGIITHNITELLIYPGIALLFVPILNVFWMFMLLLLISAYDMYAVWKSKHMIKLAKFQAKSQTFAGLLIPYQRIKKVGKKTKGKVKKTEVQNAILGGGDIAFPMLFAGVVMSDMIFNQNITRVLSFIYTLPIIICVTIALALLFFKGKKDRYYPAMPFLTLGCVAGYVILRILL